MTKKRKSRRKWWGRRPFKALKYENNQALQDWEDEVILRKIRGLKTPTKHYHAFTVDALMNTYPDLFTTARMLHRALKRMTRTTTLKRPSRRWGPNVIYELDDRPQEQEKAA